MDQIKIGSFIRELRKEKGLTQEELAEKLNVNRRSVSRWETGSNLPDLDILIEMSDFYGVELGELLAGERKSGERTGELKETVLDLAKYSNEDKIKITRSMHLLFIAGLFASLLYMILFITDRADNFLGGLCMGICTGMMIVGVIMTSKYSARITTYKAKLLHMSK